MEERDEKMNPPDHGRDRHTNQGTGRGPEREAHQVSEPISAPISAHGQAFLDELRSFFDFLQSLWGKLAGVSVFFPLFNVRFAVIPMQPLEQEGAFHLIPTWLITALATVLALFAVLSTFTHRKPLTEITRKAWISFTAGMLVLIGYLILHQVKLNLFDIWGVESGHPVHLALEMPLMVLYALFFGLMTRAFVLFGLREHYRR
jgi:hypothetical protein